MKLTNCCRRIPAAFALVAATLIPTTASAADAPVLFYGSLEQSNEWEQERKIGIYSFTDSPDNDLKAAGPVSNSSLTTGGGAYVDGYYYYLNGYANYNNVSYTFNKLNVDTWKVERTTGHYTPTLTDGYAMAYDYTTGTMYASCPKREIGVGTTGNMLRTVDLQSGEYTDVAEIDGYYPAIAFDANGQLWGIQRGKNFPNAATLHKIDKKTGKCTLVGELGLNQKSEFSAAVFDFRTGKLYWHSRTYTYNEHFEETYTSVVAEVNTSTGLATIIKTFPYSEVLASMYIRDCHPKAPQAPEATFAYSAGSETSGTVTITVPKLAYDRSTLGSNLRVEVTLDDKLIHSADRLAPGATVTTPAFNMTAGGHTLKVSCLSSEGHKSLSTDLAVYSGRDVPGTVTDITVTTSTRGETATISWKAPTVGKNGGLFDSDHLTYKVVRRPEMKTVAEGLSATTFTDEIDRKMQLSQYAIYAVSPDGSGDAANSPTLIAGQAHALPYLQTFDTQTEFLTYTIVNLNGVASADGNTWMWHPDYKLAIYWLNMYGRAGANNWLITPTVDLKAGNVYRLSFDYRGFSTQANSATTMDVCIGEQATPQSLKRSIYKDVYTNDKTFSRKASQLFVAESGDCRLGFHLTNDGKDHVGVDNIRVAYYGPGTIPAAAQNVQAYKSGDVVKVAATMPTVSANGGTLSKLTRVLLYRSDQMLPIATINTPKQGATIEFTDESPVFGDNEYTVVVANAAGNGLEATARVNTKSLAPASVDWLTVTTEADGTEVNLEWGYDEGPVSTDGEAIDASEMSYNIYCHDGKTKRAVAVGVTATSFTEPDITAIYGETGQKWCTYSVEAVTSGGSAEGVSTRVNVGHALELPVYDNFHTQTISPWLAESYSWAIQSRGYDPMIYAYEGSQLLSFVTSGEGNYISPRLNLSGLLNPEVSIYVYLDDDTRAANARIKLGVITEEDGSAQPVKWLPEVINVYNATAGWKKFTMSLKDFAKSQRASIVIYGQGVSGRRLHVDCFSVSGEAPDYDLRVLSVTGPQTCLMGRSNVYRATVKNLGKNNIKDAKLVFSVDGEAVQTLKINVDAGVETAFDFTYTPSLHGYERQSIVSAEVIADRDDNDANNTARMRINVEQPNVPYVDELHARVENGNIILSWEEASQYPKALVVRDDFDSYADFLIEGFGSWTVVDGDKSATIQGIQSTMGTYNWENAGLPQAWIVFNPAKVGVTGLATAHSGNKCLVSFCGASANDDWLISPQLLGAKQTISFFARVMNSYYNKEQMEILYSRTGTDIADFTSLGTTSVTTDSWRQYQFELPAGARYFAIRCISDGQFGLMIDDIDYIPAQPAVDLFGYNVYRDGECVANAIGETEFIDSSVTEPQRVFTYHVKALYSDGESIPSPEVQAGLTGLTAAGADAVEVSAKAGAIVVKGAEGLTLTVADLQGRLLYRFIASDAEELSVAPGLYLVNVGGTTHKLLVK